MESQESTIARRLRIAGVLVLLGLLVESFTLGWNNPISFLLFLGVGGLLMLVGIAVYLLSLVSRTNE